MEGCAVEWWSQGEGLFLMSLIPLYFCHAEARVGADPAVLLFHGERSFTP